VTTWYFDKMASEAAALLDQLMGRGRNAGAGESVKKEHWSDPEVCKWFLCGFCPSNLFVNTRSDIGKRYTENGQMQFPYTKRYTAENGQ
jgi:hypothetical protein